MGREEENYNSLEGLAADWGATLFGVGDAGDLLPSCRHMAPSLSSGLQRAVSMGILLSRKIMDDIIDHPTKLYSHHYGRVNNLLDQLGIVLANRIQTLGYEALPVPASQIVDWENQEGLVSHREMAHRAGLGFRGLNSLLVNARFGAQVRLITVLTDMPLKVDNPLDEDYCAECMACPPVCPAKAIGEKPEDFDRWACFEKLKEFSKKYNIGHYICGICVKACPGQARPRY